MHRVVKSNSSNITHMKRGREGEKEGKKERERHTHRDKEILREHEIKGDGHRETER